MSETTVPLSTTSYGATDDEQGALDVGYDTPSAADDLADELDDDGGEDSEELDTEDDVEQLTQGSVAPARRAVSNRALVRRVAAKAQVVIDAPAERRALLAALLGVDDDPTELTVAIMVGDRSALTAVSDLEQVAGEGPFEAAVKAQEKGRPRMRAMHALLRSLGEVDTASLNSSDSKAAVAIAKAAHSLSEAARTEMAAVVELARKS